MILSKPKILNKKKTLFRLYQNKNKKLFLRKRFKIKILLKLKKEGKNKKLINNDIEQCLNWNFKKDNFKFFDYLQNKEIKIGSKSRLTFLYLFFYYKHFVYNIFKRKKQYFYLIFNLILLINVHLKTLVQREVFLFSNLKIGLENKNIRYKINYFEEILFLPRSKSLIINKQKESLFSLIWHKSLNSFFVIYFQLYFIFVSLNFQKIKDYNSSFSILFFNNNQIFFSNLEHFLLKEFVFKLKNNELKIKTLFYRKELQALFSGRTTIWNNFLKNNSIIPFIFERLNSKNLNSLWKLSKNNKKSNFENEISFGLIYFIMRLEEKLKNINLTDEKTKQTLSLLINLFTKKINKKLKVKKYFLYNLNFIKQIKNKKKRLTFFSDLNKIKSFNKKIFNIQKINNNKFFKKNPKIKSFKKIISFKKIKFKSKKYKKLLKVGLWKEKKLKEKSSLISFKNFPQIFSVILGIPTSLIFVNALTVTKFGFKTKTKGAHRFLNRVERDLIQRYKYIAIYIQDFLRVCFFSFFLKKPTFLVNFIAFQIARLPRNRKETSFIRFIIKFIKIFGAQRREITAIKIEFKGRVNRWRRTKIIRGMRNVISYVRYDSAIEFGSGKAITRKGTLGIRLWLAYKFTEVSTIRKALLSYILYSQVKKAKKISQFLKIYSNKQLKKI